MVNDDQVYFGDVEGNIYAVSLRRGEQQWTDKLDGPITASPLLSNGSIFYFTQAGTIYSRDALENTPNWQVEVNGAIYSKPVITDDKLIVATINPEAILVAINSDSGSQIWTFNYK
jgi:outer membrane protein assembly factor BamB